MQKFFTILFKRATTAPGYNIVFCSFIKILHEKLLDGNRHFDRTEPTFYAHVCQIGNAERTLPKHLGYTVGMFCPFQV